MTAAPHGRRAEEAPPRRSGAVWGIVGVAVGAVVATIATWALLSGELGPFARWLDSVLNLLLAALGGFGVALLLAVLVAWWWLRRFVGTAQGTLGRLISDAAEATRAAAENNAAAAVSHAERALHEAAAWYAPIAARRFVVQTALALLVTFGGLVGTGLLFRQTLLLGTQNSLLEDQNRKIDRQTALLEDQNRKIDMQTVTAEAQRRAGLTQELFSILLAVSQITPPDRLPSGLVARVVAFSHAAEGYWIPEIPDRTSDGEVPVPRYPDRPRSPERGQLLRGLVIASVDVPTLTQAGVTFADADLRRADLRSANLSGADLSGANLGEADLSDANLSRANLSGTNLSGANLSEANLSEANLSRADLSGALLFGANLGEADLSDANLSEVIIGPQGTPGQSPEGFPKGWSAPPAGWEMFERGNAVRLRRVTAPSAAPSSPPR